jgi:hypothetical protein
MIHSADSLFFLFGEVCDLLAIMDIHKTDYSLNSSKA